MYVLLTAALSSPALCPRSVFVFFVKFSKYKPVITALYYSVMSLFAISILCKVLCESICDS